MKTTEGRLFVIEREVKQRHKLMAMNKKSDLKSTAVQIKKWTKDRKSYEYNAGRLTVPYRRRFSELSAYQVALDEKRRMSDPTVFGTYNGASFRELKPAIRKVIEDNHPTVLRLKETEKLLTEGVDRGEIIPLDQSKGRFDKLMSKPVVEYKKHLKMGKPKSKSLWDLPGIAGFFDFRSKFIKPKTPTPDLEEHHQHYRKLVLPPLYVRKQDPEVILQRFKRLGTSYDITERRQAKVTFQEQDPKTSDKSTALPKLTKLQIAKQKTVI